MALRRDPMLSPKILARPLESNVLEWHYVIEGSTGTPYEGGFYHGRTYRLESTSLLNTPLMASLMSRIRTEVTRIRFPWT